MNYETSLPHEIEAEIARMPVAYLPWGAHEWHGFHNPVGVDGLKVKFLARELCREVGGVVFPTVYCGHRTIGFPYCIDFSKETLASLAREHLQGISKMGFKVIVLLLGHWAPEHRDTLNQVVDEFNASQSQTHAWSVQDNHMTEDFGYPEDHGGVGETSYMMACLSDKVDLSRLPERGLSFEQDGIAGEDPRPRASSGLGMDAARIYVREAAKRVRAMLG